MAFSTSFRKLSSAQFLVKMGACEPEASSAVRPLSAPGQDFRAALRLGDVGVFARCPLARESRRRDWPRPDRGHALHLWVKPHVEVPLILDRERLHASRDRMVGQALYLGQPVWVDRDTHGRRTRRSSRVSSVTALCRRYFDRVMQAGHAHALVHILLQRLEPVSLDHGMAAAAVHEEHQGGCPLEDRLSSSAIHRERSPAQHRG